MAFSQAAERLIKDYLMDFMNKIKRTDLDPKPGYLRLILTDIEHILRFHGIEEALRRGAKVVEEKDIRVAINKLGKPEKLARSEFKGVKSAIKRRQNLILNLILGMNQLLNQGFLLDAGCGWGRLIMEMKCFRDDMSNVIGVDLGVIPLMYAKDVIKDANFVRADMRFLPFKDGFFKALVAVGAIHEMKSMNEVKKAFKEFFRVLRTGGLLYLMDIFSRLKAICYLSRLLQHLTSNFERCFSIKDVINALSLNKFSDLTTVMLTRHLHFFEVHLIVAERS